MLSKHQGISTGIVANVVVRVDGTDLVALYHRVVPRLAILRIMENIIQHLRRDVIKQTSHLDIVNIL